MLMCCAVLGHENTKSYVDNAASRACLLCWRGTLCCACAKLLS